MTWQSLVLLSLLAGCSGMNYQQEGKSASATEQDILVCEDKILAEHDGLRHATAKEKEAWMDHCMKERGYRLKPR